MKLEDEIKQSKFRSVYQKLNLNLLFTSNWIRDKHRKSFEEVDITPQQYNALRILKGNYPKPYSTSQIRERMLDKMSDTSRIVDRLIQKGLVERKTCTSDRRLVDVVITKKGLNLLAQSNKAIDNQEELFRKLTEEEAKQLNDLLDKIRS